MAERGVSCSQCGELRWFDPKAGDPGCPCGGSVKRKNNLRVTGMYSTPIEMYSVGGVEEYEKESFTRACPGVDLNPEGVPIARTRQQKKQVLRHFGFQENN